MRRFGVRELFLKPTRYLFAAQIIRRLPEASFRFQGWEYPYFYHRYNITWAGERSVEVPIVRKMVSEYKPDEVLEVGNVLSHYGAVRHTIVDKFEQGRGVINEDIIHFETERRFSLIVSVSTFEHIGFDDDSPTSCDSGKRIIAAISHCRHLLTADGKLVISVPIGYNPDLDALISSRQLGAAETGWLRRVGFTRWTECSMDEAFASPYGRSFPYANSLLFASFRRS